MLDFNRWLVLALFIVPTFALAPFLLIAPGMGWARLRMISVLQNVTLNPRVSFPPQWGLVFSHRSSPTFVFSPPQSWPLVLLGPFLVPQRGRYLLRRVRHSPRESTPTPYLRMLVQGCR